MDIRTYLTHTDATAIYPDAGSGTVGALAYLGLGLAEESAEVLEKELAGDRAGVAAELGDVSWHLARVHRELALDPAETFRAAVTPRLPAPAPTVHLVLAAGTVAGLTQKAIRDDAGEVTVARRDALAAALVPVMRAWVAVNLCHALDPAETLAANVAKLADRRDRGVLSGSGDHR